MMSDKDKDDSEDNQSSDLSEEIDEEENSEEENSDENSEEDSEDNSKLSKKYQKQPSAMVTQLKKQYKLYSRACKENNVDIKALIIEGDANEITDVIEKYPNLLSKFTTEALFRFIFSGDEGMYEYLLSEGGEPDCIEVLQSGVAWGSSKIMTWCRDHMKLDSEGKELVRAYLSMCKDPKSEAGTNKTWISLIEQ